MNRLSTLLLMLFISQSLLSQKLEENYKDEFTGSTIKKTGWSTLSMTKNLAAFIRVSKINNLMYFELKLNIGGKVFAVDKGKEIMFKLENGEIIKLFNTDYKITCIGCASKGILGANTQGIHIKYDLPQEKANKLLLNQVQKVRVVTNDGYVEDEIKKKNKQRIIKSLKIIL